MHQQSPARLARSVCIPVHMRRVFQTDWTLADAHSLFLDNSPHLSADAVLALNAAAVIANIKLQAQQRQKDEQRPTTATAGAPVSPDLWLPQTQTLLGTDI